MRFLTTLLFTFLYFGICGVVWRFSILAAKKHLALGVIVFVACAIVLALLEVQ